MNKKLENHYLAFIQELEKLNITTAPNIKVIFEAGWYAALEEFYDEDSKHFESDNDDGKVPKIPKFNHK